jgi:hypothetical protein
MEPDHMVEYWRHQQLSECRGGSFVDRSGGAAGKLGRGATASDIDGLDAGSCRGHRSLRIVTAAIAVTAGSRERVR